MSRAEGSPSSGDQQVVRWYTRARRFPQLIGRTPDGARIPGGPYTITQVATAGVLMLIALKTTSLWAHYGLIANGLLLAGVVYGVVFLLGKIPLGSRSPLAIGAGAWRALTAPTTGRLGGRPVRLRAPHRVRHRMTVFIPTAPAAASTPVTEPLASAPQTLEPEPATAAVAQPAEPVQTPARQTTTSRRRSKARSSLGHRRPAPDAPLEQLPAAAATAPAQPQPTAPAPVPASAPALSGVQALLAQGAASQAMPPTTLRNS